MRLPKKASSGIVKASRTSRDRKKKIAAFQKKAAASLKAAKKALTRLKADAKETAKQFGIHLMKAEEYFTRVEELGGESPYFPSKDWEDSLMSEIDTILVSTYDEVEEIKL